MLRHFWLQHCHTSLPAPFTSRNCASTAVVAVGKKPSSVCSAGQHGCHPVPAILRSAAILCSGFGSLCYCSCLQPQHIELPPFRWETCWDPGIVKRCSVPWHTHARVCVGYHISPACVCLVAVSASTILHFVLCGSLLAPSSRITVQLGA